MHRVLKFTALSLAFLGVSCARAQDLSSTRAMIFEEKFDGAAIDTGNWALVNRAGDYSNHELGCYRPSNAGVGNGVLTIASQAQGTFCGDADHAKTLFHYTSAMLQWAQFSFTYGTVAVRAKTSGGQGSWPAVWLLGSNCQASNLLSADNIGTCNWPHAGSEEIDVLEIANSSYTTVYHNFFNGAGYFCQQNTTDTSKNWHVYTMRWAPNLITFAIDGVPANCRFTAGIPSTPMFLIINNAMGGLGGTVNNPDFPQAMLVDYVRVYAP